MDILLVLMKIRINKILVFCLETNVHLLNDSINIMVLDTYSLCDNMMLTVLTVEDLQLRYSGKWASAFSHGSVTNAIKTNERFLGIIL